MPQPNSRIAPRPDGGHVMITDHGEHPPELYAQMAAEQIAPIGNVTGARRKAAIALNAKITDVLEKHHQKIHDDEASKLGSDPDHHAKEPDPAAYLDAALDDIATAAEGTDWEHQFRRGNGRPAWLDAHLADVDKMGGDAEPLTPAQQTELDNYNREQLIRQLIGTHMATHQHVRRSWHRDALKGTN